MAKRNYYMKAPGGEVFTTSNPEYHKECEELPNDEGARIYRAQMVASIKKTLKPGSTVYTSIRSVSSSGMSRRIRTYMVTKDRQIADITYIVSVITGHTLRDGDIVMTGCGMDMGFALVYDFGQSLWPKGTPKSHGVRNGRPDREGGYALKHSWI